MSSAGLEVLSGSNQGPERFPVPPFHFLQERTFLLDVLWWGIGGQDHASLSLESS